MEIQLRNQGTINTNIVTIVKEDKTILLYFSYKTMVACKINEKLYCSINEWSRATGKFINIIEPNKKHRILHQEVMAQLGEVL